MSAAPRKREAVLPGELLPERGQAYWRSLEELAHSQQFEDLLRAEFPEPVLHPLHTPSRREFLTAMAASLALAHLGGCVRQPREEIIPYARDPEHLVPGKPLFYASAAPLWGVAEGIVVECHMGRPVKIEGNPRHPSSLGATSLQAQAMVLDLYDPDRSKVVRRQTHISTWESFREFSRPLLADSEASRGAGIRILTEPLTSPTLAGQLQRFLKQYPEARLHQYTPIVRDAVRRAAWHAFGREAEPIYHLDRAAVILTLDADLLAGGRNHLRHARDFAARRDPGNDNMSRLYAVEITPSCTGSVADHRWALTPQGVADFARCLARSLGAVDESVPCAQIPGMTQHIIRSIAGDLQAHRGQCLVVPGEYQPAEVHALAHAMNDALGNIHRTVTFIAPVERMPGDIAESLEQLTTDLRDERVEVLIILGSNPAYDAPADLGFAGALTRAKHSVHLGLYRDETASLCEWHLPQAHFLEAWGDLAAADGTITIQQPGILPLYEGKSVYEVMNLLTEDAAAPGLQILREHWSRHLGSDEHFESYWRQALHDGVVPGTAHEELPVRVSRDLRFARDVTGPPARAVSATFRPDATIHDGRFANNAWLQELPKTMTTLTWDNAGLLSPRTAERLGVSSGSIIQVTTPAGVAEVPVLVAPGQADECLTMSLGYGRTRAGSVGSGRGYSAYRLRGLANPWDLVQVGIRTTGRTTRLATTQNHHLINGSDLVREATLEDLGIDQEPGQSHPAASALTLLPQQRPGPYAWGMTIDLNTCIGCNACMVACQAENNIPAVGRQEVLRGRELHWIRVDRYYRGSPEDPRFVHQPVPCMHCENAPCEVVCPTAATVHSDEGLNEMIYNRCVGTRYCSNNCPYKVRRFNYFNYVDEHTGSLKLLRNPDVTVRTRGVMEKCTYCVQRINSARITAKKERRAIQDGEIVTACQAVCPVQAIEFGNLLDPNSRVSVKKADRRNYGMLAELNTRPRTTYLKRVNNPNPELVPET